MLRSLNGMLGYQIGAEDDEFGEVSDFYFDDFGWGVRYLLVDTGRWLPGRRVLISPTELGTPQWDRSVLPVSLTREQIENSPPIASDAPVSRESEMLLARHYGWAAYWESLPERLGESYAREATADARELMERHANSQLRSAREVEGYSIIAADGEIGQAADLIVEADDWIIRYLVVDTSKWLPGALSKKVLISPAWTTDIEWAQRSVRVQMTREQVENSPRYDPAEPINRQYEVRLYDYYGRPRYWQGRADKG
jgi:hypothetical protein